MKNKKGQAGLNKILLVVGVFVLIGVLFTYGGFFVGNVQDINEKTYKAINETKTVDELPVVLDGTINNGNCKLLSLEAYNQTGGELITSTNHTTTTNCTVYFSGGQDQYNNTNWNLTYTYNFNREGFYNITSQGTTGFSNFSDFYVIIGIIVMAIVLMGLLFLFKEVL